MNSSEACPEPEGGERGIWLKVRIEAIVVAESCATDQMLFCLDVEKFAEVIAAGEGEILLITAGAQRGLAIGVLAFVEAGGPLRSYFVTGHCVPAAIIIAQESNWTAGKLSDGIS